MKTELNIELMKKAAQLFVGEKDFWSYAYKPSAETNTNSVVDSCHIEENTLFTANFFPEESFCFRVSGKGFKRHQVRLMMGVLFDLGMGKITLEEFEKTLDGSNKIHLSHIAPSSGLMLFKTELTI
jgi:tRNA pseudouridine38-40 synthase